MRTFTRALTLGVGLFILAFGVGLTGMTFAPLGSRPAQVAALLWLGSPALGLAAAAFVVYRAWRAVGHVDRERAARIRRGRDMLAHGALARAPLARGRTSLATPRRAA